MGFDATREQGNSSESLVGPIDHPREVITYLLRADQERRPCMMLYAIGTAERHRNSSLLFVQARTSVAKQKAYRA